MNIGIHNRYLHVCGGGEKYSTMLAEVLSMDHTVDIITSRNIEKRHVEQKLNVDLRNVTIYVVSPERENIFFIKKKYDILIHATFSLNLTPFGKKNIQIISFPNRIIFADASQSLARFIKFLFFDNKNFIELLCLSPQIFHHFLYLLSVCFFSNRLAIPSAYSSILANSNFTKRWIKNFWNIESEVLYPAISVHDYRVSDKKNIILSVGRFFEDSHNKKHIPMIKEFKKMCDEGLVGWKYYCVGGTHTEQEHQDYLKRVHREAIGYPVEIIEDISFGDLIGLYGVAKIFWHATGYGEDITVSPVKFEHFGITTVEAMASGCVPIVINGGGQSEIVQHNENGYLWNSLDELVKYTLMIINDEKLYGIIQKKAHESRLKFSKELFSERVNLAVSKVMNG